MIRVLQNWQEIEEATQFLEQQGLSPHLTQQKNWDQFLFYQLLHNQSRDISVLDLGCGDCCTLDFLASCGFVDLHGIDLQISKAETQLPYRLYQDDITATSFPDRSFGVAVSISVIEHGVDLDAFFKEVNRLLKPGGLLFVTADYWETKIHVEESIKPFGLSWTIFSRAEIEAAIAIAHQHGFALESDTSIPACTDKPVSWYDKHYTFIALAFRKN